MDSHISKVKSSMRSDDFDRVTFRHDISTGLVESDELLSAIQKRLVNGDTRSRSVPMVSLVLCILSEDDYNINHNTVNGTHMDTFMKIWEFIGTISVSSTLDLRTILSTSLRGRDYLGYMRKVDTSIGSHKSSGPGNNLFRKKQKWEFMESEAGVSYDNLRESIVVDAAAVTSMSKSSHASRDVRYITKML